MNHQLSPLRGYGFLSSVFLGLTPKATCYRHYVAGKSQLQNLRVGLVCSTALRGFIPPLPSRLGHVLRRRFAIPSRDKGLVVFPGIDADGWFIDRSDSDAVSG
jgi:hypothetical protein